MDEHMVDKTVTTPPWSQSVGIVRLDLHHLILYSSFRYKEVIDELLHIGSLMYYAYLFGCYDTASLSITCGPLA